jgi:hypothetical protein
MSKKSSKKTGKAKFEDFDVDKAIHNLEPPAPPPMPAPAVAEPAPAADPQPAAPPPEPIEYVPIPMEAKASTAAAAAAMPVTVGITIGGGPSLMSVVGIGMQQIDSTALVKEPGPPAKKQRVTVEGAPPPPIPEELTALL